LANATLKDDQHFGYITNLEMEGKRKRKIPLMYITKLKIEKKNLCIGRIVLFWSCEKLFVSFSLNETMDYNKVSYFLQFVHKMNRKVALPTYMSANEGSTSG
jgi:hypothetical protein